MFHMRFDLICKFVTAFYSLTQNDSGMNYIASQFIGQRNGCCFDYSRMADDGTFYFGWAQTVTTYLDYIINAPDYPVIAIFVLAGWITGEVPFLFAVFFPIFLHIAIGISQYIAGHSRPGRFQYQIPFFPGFYFFAFVVNNGDFEAKKRFGGRTGFQGHGRNWSNGVPAGFRLPPGIHNGATAFADDFIIPFPGFGVYRFTYRTKQSQWTQVVPVGPGWTETHQSTNGSRRGVEYVNAIFFNHLPPAIWIGMIGRAFIHHYRSPIDKRTVNHVTVTGYPARVSSTPKTIFGFDVEYIFECRCGIYCISAVGMHQTLWLSGGAGSI